MSARAAAVDVHVRTGWAERGLRARMLACEQARRRTAEEARAFAFPTSVVPSTQKPRELPVVMECRETFLVYCMRLVYGITFFVTRKGNRK